jgi:hypothetical protein
MADMAESLDLKIVRVSIENEDTPCRVSIRAEVDELTQLRAIADKFRRSKERIPAQLVIGSTEERPPSRDTIRAEEIEQVIVEGLAAMHHSGQIARDLIRRFQGRILAGDE